MPDTPETKTAGTQIADAVEKFNTTVGDLKKDIDGLKKDIEEKSKVQSPWGAGVAPAVILGELPNNSKPFSFGRLVKARIAVANNQSPDEVAKTEMDFCRRTASAFGWEGSMAVPLGASYLEDSGDSSLAKEWRQMDSSRGVLDYDELAKVYQSLGKDLTFRTATTGGTLVSMPAQGELIELLRATSWSTRAGFREVPLPAQGAMRFPRVTSGVTISSYAESEAATESTPGTSDVELEAKGYTGLVEVTEQFLKFADTVAGDAFVRQEMTADMNLKVDRDLIDGPGGKSIQGLINYSGITTHDASTLGANGNTLEPVDIDVLIAKMADANTPVDSGTTLVMRNRLWAALKHRADTNGRPKFVWGAEAYGGGRVQQTFSGYPVVTSSQIPATRVKASSGATLTMVMAVIGSEILMGRAGAIEIKMTDSHGSNFASGIMTLRGTLYCDAVPRHESSIGLIDTLLPS